MGTARRKVRRHEMSDSFRRQSIWLAMIPAFGLAACVVFQGDGDGEGGTDDLTPETSLPIAAGRSFAVLSSLNQDREVLERRVYPSLSPVAPAELPKPGEPDLAGDPDWIGISRFVARWCQEPLEARLEVLGDGPAASTLRQGQHYLCMGHTYLNMAVSPLPTVIEASDFDHIKYVDQPSEALNLAHVTIRQPASTEPPIADAGPPIYEIPPQSASDAATLALVASEYFRGALFMHAMILRHCADNPCVLGDQVPAGRRDGEDTDNGLSEDETVAAASVAITGMIESWRATREASDETERLLLAASQARMSDSSGDSRQARILS
jgi:hypothetical protein